MVIVSDVLKKCVGKFIIFKCFISFNYMRNILNKVISEELIRQFFVYRREVIYNYYKIAYKTDYLGTENGNKFYNIDESCFCKDVNGSHLWVIGAIENDTRDFMIILSRDRDANTIKKFITRFIPKGNKIVTDGWPSYDWLDNTNSGY